MGEVFLWGAVSSAHQIEGNNIHNDWWEAEQRGQVPFKSGRAADHWQRWRQDYALIKELGHTAYCTSLEWSRIEPEAGRWNQRALVQYGEMLQTLRSKGMKIFVTLHHFTNPRWLAARGGWRSAEAPELFARYVRVVAEQIGDRVDFWVTINEPSRYAAKAFRQGVWPPQVKSRWAAGKVLYHMMQAHRRAYRVLHRVRPEALVGLADDASTLSGRFFWHGTKGTHDFLSINNLEDRAALLVDRQRYRRPIYVIGNGLADADDSRRADFLVSNLRLLEEAQRQGADVRGYFYGSLLDGFEWEKGLEPRRGLVAVDFETMERTPRRSAYVYRAIIEQAMFDVEKYKGGREKEREVWRRSGERSRARNEGTGRNWLR